MAPRRTLPDGGEAILATAGRAPLAQAAPPLLVPRHQGVTLGIRSLHAPTPRRDEGGRRLPATRIARTIRLPSGQRVGLLHGSSVACRDGRTAPIGADFHVVGRSDAVKEYRTADCVGATRGQAPDSTTMARGRLKGLYPAGSGCKSRAGTTSCTWSRGIAARRVKPAVSAFDTACRSWTAGAVHRTPRRGGRGLHRQPGARRRRCLPTRYDDGGG